MFLFLPILLIIIAIQIAIKNGGELGNSYSNITLGLTFVFAVMPLVICILVYGAHFIISRTPNRSEIILKSIAFTPYVCFLILILPQMIVPNKGSWVLSALYGVTGNLKGLNEFLTEVIFANSSYTGSLVVAIVNIIMVLQYFLIFSLYLNLYYWFNRKGSRDYQTPTLIEFIASNRLVILGFFLIFIIEVLNGISTWQSVFITNSIIQTENEYLRLLLMLIEVLSPLFFPIVMILFFPLILPKIAGWQILPECSELTMLRKTAKDNNFKYNKIYLATNPGLVTAGVIGIFSRTTNLLFTKDIFKLLNEKELESVMLHEIGHSKYSHIIYYMLFLFLIFQSIIIIIANVFSFTTEVQLSLLVFLIIFSIRYGWGWLSRQCERQADLNAAEVQGTPEHIVNSFLKISALGHSLDRPSWHHGSLRERIDNLKNSFQEGGIALRKAYHRKIKIIKATIILLFFIFNGSLIYFNYYAETNQDIKDFNRFNDLAMVLMVSKNYQESEKYFLKSIDELTKAELPPQFKSKKDQSLLVSFYNLACLYSLDGKLENAMLYLRKGLPLYDKDIMDPSKVHALNVYKVETDPDLQNLRKLQDYLAFVEELKNIEKKFGIQSWKSEK